LKQDEAVLPIAKFSADTQMYKQSLNNEQGTYKFGKMKFPEFSRPSKQTFPDNYEEKTRCSELT